MLQITNRKSLVISNRGAQIARISPKLLFRPAQIALSQIARCEPLHVQIAVRIAMPFPVQVPNGAAIILEPTERLKIQTFNLFRLAPIFSLPLYETKCSNLLELRGFSENQPTPILQEDQIQVLQHVERSAEVLVPKSEGGRFPTTTLPSRALPQLVSNPL